MGRPKLHDEQTRAALLHAAEGLVARGGSQALSLRRLAEATNTTTRAVYSVFGNKEGLFSALFRQSFQELMHTIEHVPATDDPARDLVRVGIEGFRRYAMEHPNLFRLVFERIVPDTDPRPEDAAVARQALALLHARVQRLADAGLLPGRSVETVATQFHALCQGLASNELRNGLFGSDDPESVWEDALSALVQGFGTRQG